MSPEDAIAKVGMVVEGMFTAEAAYELAKIAGVATPCIDAIVQVGRTILDDMDEGRTAEALGIAGMDREALLTYVNG